MPDRRTLLRAFLLGATGLAVPVACGLPSGGRPIIDGAGPPLGSGANDSDLKAPLPDDADGPEDLVNKYLGAVAGKLETSADLGKAIERAKKFLTPNAANSWQDNGQIAVVRRIGQPVLSASGPGATSVQITIKLVGVLQTDGTVEPLGAPSGPRTVRFSVVQGGTSSARASLRIDGVTVLTGDPLPTWLMLDSEGLDNNWYLPQLVYFWATDNDRPGLVPDLRYVPRVNITVEAQRTEIVDWMLSGPSDWLSGAVQANLYGGINLLGPNLVDPGNDPLVVNLSAPPPQTLPLDRVMAQLRWSLRPSYADSVRLQVNSQDQQVDGSSTAFRRFNLADETYFKLGDDDLSDDSEFCVADGAVRRIDLPTQLPAALDDPDNAQLNKNVRLAALSRDKNSAALVKTDNRLYVGGVHGGAKPVFNRAELPGTEWSRPAFLPANGPRVLVVVDGRLYLVQMTGLAAEISTGRQHVTAFSIAPDGHRIALIADGAAWVGSLRVDADTVSVGPLRSIDCELYELTAIAWSRLDRVLVAGRTSTNYQLSETTIDGAICTTWSSAAYSYRISSVVARPISPWDSSASTQSSSPGQVMVQTANNVAYRTTAVYSRSISFYTKGLTGVAPTISPTPNNLGSPSNPFYLD